jgi:hypothetical protein
LSVLSALSVACVVCVFCGLFYLWLVLRLKTKTATPRCGQWP